MNNLKGVLAISPLLVFITLYLVTSIIADDFYKVPISVAFMISGIYAVAIAGGKNLQKNVAVFSRGASSPNIMTMLWIFVLAGAFANSAKAIGAVDATVNTMLSLLPSNMVLPGLFIATCFISLSIGTSVGTIVALVPIASGLAQTMQLDVALLTAVVVGGAFFGDNLSFISDTTIAATSTQGCKMNDKFRVNFFITLPAAIITLALYVFLGQEMQPLVNVHGINYLKILPYIAVLSTAIAGMNVMLVLTIGLAITGVIGLLDGSFDVFEWFHSMGDGILSMGELIIITMLAGGVFEIVQKKGGIDFIIAKTTAGIKGKRGAEAVIGLMVAIVDLCTANNTVAIISTGKHRTTHQRTLQTGQAQGGKSARYVLVLRTGFHSLRRTDAYGCRTDTAEPRQNNAISVLPHGSDAVRSCGYHLPSATQILLTFLDTPHHLNTSTPHTISTSHHLNTLPF